MRDVRINEILFKSYISKLRDVLFNEKSDNIDPKEILKNVIAEMEEDLKKA